MYVKEGESYFPGNNKRDGIEDNDDGGTDHRVFIHRPAELDGLLFS
jgi:hypothetical protein